MRGIIRRFRKTFAPQLHRHSDQESRAMEDFADFDFREGLKIW
jgi:hypothetical protein